MPGFDFNDDEETEQETTPEVTEGNFQKLRAHTRKLERDLKKLEEERAELRTFKAQAEQAQRKNTATSVFSELGLGEKQATAYLAMNPDSEINRESAITWAKDLGFQVVASDEEQEVSEQESTSFRPVSIGGVVPTRGRVSYEQYRTLMASDPSAAVKLIQEGRVDGLMHSA